MYRPNTGLISELAKCLWQQHTHFNKPKLLENTDQCNADPNKFRKVLDHLNDKMYSQAKTYLAKEKNNPFYYANTDLEKLINDTDPILWETVVF